MAGGGSARRALHQLGVVVGRRHRRRMMWVAALMMLVAVLEFISIAALLPLFSVALGSGGGEQGALQRMMQDWGLYPHTTAGLIWFAGAVLTIFVLKVALTTYSLWEGYRFSYEIQVSAGERVLTSLLSREYDYFLQQNTAVLVKTATSEVLLLAGGVLIPLMTFLTQVLILITVTLVIALVSPGAALVAGGMVGLLVGGLFVLLNRRLDDWGVRREARLADMHRVAQQALSGVKMVKTHGSEHGYVEALRRAGDDYAAVNTRHQVAAATPPLLIELLLFGGMTAVILYFAWAGSNLVEVLPGLGVFAVGAYRILPAGRRAFADLVTMRYYWPSLRRVAEEIEAVPATDGPESGRAGTPLPRLSHSIELRDVAYRYPGADRAALSDVSMRIEHGSHVAIVGRSGAGKSTLVDVILGLLNPTTGSVRVDGVDLTRDNLSDWLCQVGYVSQHIFVADTTLAENVAFGVPADAIDRAEVRRVLEGVQLRELLARLPQGIDTPVGENGARLSGGERQRLGIARALYRKPALLLLDEATSALDTVTERAVNDDVLASCRDITVIIVAHRLATVRNCDRLVLLDAGGVERVGTYDELVASSGRFAEMHRQAMLHGTE